MTRRFVFTVLVATSALTATVTSAEQHLAELHASILACEDQSCVGEAASFCMETTDGGYSTFGMMDCLLKENDVWDEQLNIVYREARAFAKAMDAADKDLFPEYAVRDMQLLEAQRAWIAFRDANCAMEYGVWGAGSMRQIAGADCLLEMTSRRVFELRAYTDALR